MKPGSPISNRRQSSRVSAWRNSTIGLMLLVQLGCHARVAAPFPNSSVHATAVTVQPGSSAEALGSRTATHATAPQPMAKHSDDSDTPEGNPSPTILAGLLEGQWTELPLTGFEPAVVWYRPSAPLMVVTHGAGGEAEWHCHHFHQLLAGRVTLLCPRGKRRHARDPSQGYYYPDHFALRREVLALVEQFETATSHAGPRRPYLYAGYSQGATMGALAFADVPGLFARLVLVEGGFADWSSLLVTQARRNGVETVLFVCGTDVCHKQARVAVNRFEQVGIRAKLAWARGAGHRPDGAVESALVENLPFVLGAALGDASEQTGGRPE